MKRLVGVSASARIWGNCEAAVKSVLVSAMEAGATTEFVRLAELRIEPCKGCFACLTRKGACPTGDDLYPLLKQLQQADGLVLAAPVYFGLPPAVLINLLDRLLAMHGFGQAVSMSRPAVTMTVVGNLHWRGVARPAVNQVAGLLGFTMLDSMHLVAEGPGEVLRASAVERFQNAGKALATDDRPAVAGYDPGSCPTCGSDFFRIERATLICPICGDQGDLSAYVADGRFVRSGGERRWGLAWLARHVEAWIRPSIVRYKGTRRQALKQLQDLKSLYAFYEGGGKEIQ